MIVPGIVNEQVTPVSLTIADLDGVGNLDVAIGTVLLNNLNQPGYFSIVINTGNDGANQPIFANSVNIDTLDSNTRAIVSGDFDNDSDIDLAVASAAGSSVNSVSVLLNDGSGTSGVVNRFRLSGTTTTVGRLIVGDINADTFLDLITINQSHSYSVLLNDGGTDITKAGEYSDQGQFPLGSQAGPALDIPTDGGLGDFDGDGDLDLVSGLVGSSGGTGSLVILPNDGTGLFGTEVPFAIGRDHTFLGVADIDGDADPDVLSVDVFQATATVLLNRLFPVVDVALRAVINPTLTQEGALPVGLTQVCPGSGFIVEVWVSQVNGGTEGIAGGSVDLLFDSATVTATSIDHGSVFNDTTNPDVIVTGLVDDLGGATTDLERAVGPNWALLARVPVTVTGSGPFTFSLNHGAFAFALAGGLPPLVNAAVNVTETLSVDVVVVDDGVNCTSDSCDEVNHVAIHTPNDASCGNGLFCDGVETCNVTLDCQAGTAPTIDDGVTCTDDSCDEVNDVIVHAVNDSLCDNDQFCDGVETCNATLDCQAGTAPTIDDGVTCTDDSCDEVNAIIVNTPNDTNCNDSIVCTTDVCDLVFDCVNSALIYDLDESNLVDFSDFALFAPRFATFAGDLDYDACSDFYFDDVIDAADVSFFGTAFGKTCDDTTIVTPDTGHLPPLGCPAGPLGVLAAVEKDGDSVTLEVNAVVVGLPSLFTSSDTFPVSHTDPIGIRSTFFVEVWVRMSGETAMGITGGSLSLHVDPELATPISASVDDGFPWFQDGEIDASTGSVINLSGGTLQTGAAVGEWVRFASVEFMSHHPGARSLDLVQGHMVFAQYAVGAMAPEAVTLTGTQITIEVIKRQRRSHREGG